MWPATDKQRVSALVEHRQHVRLDAVLDDHRYVGEVRRLSDRRRRGEPGDAGGDEAGEQDAQDRTEAGTQRMRDVWDVEQRAQNAAFAAAQVGATCESVDAAARKVITDAGFGENFGHGLGHGVGVDIHEAPRLSPESKDTLEVGHVFSVEPGIYVPGLGGVRIEDLVVLREDGVELLMAPELSVVLLRRVGWGPGDYRAWSERALAEGMAFVVPTTWAGETVLRFCFVNPLTSEADVALILDSLA